MRANLWIGGVVLAASLLVTTASAETVAEDVLGTYWFPERNGTVELYEKNGRYYGKVLTFDTPNQKDENNPDPKLRERQFVGIDMFENFRFDAEEQQWVDGTVYDATDGSTYSSYLWFEGDDRATLWGRGYIGISLFGRTERFDRVEPTASE